MVKRNDFILIGSVIIICLAVILFMNYTKKDGSHLVVTVDGKQYDTFDLKKDTTFIIKSQDSYNTIEIKDGYVSMTKASCPDKLCIKQSHIHYNHETIVCLPNRIILEVVGGDEDNLDVIAK